MVMPSFNDLGKSAKDIFTKKFKFGRVNFDFKSKTENDVDVSVCCTTNNDDASSASGDIKFSPGAGIYVKTKVDSNWLITNDIEISEKIRSTKHNIISSVNYISGEKNLKLKNSFKEEHISADLEFDFASKYPSTTGSLVVGNKGYLAGAQVVCDTNGMALKKYVYSLGYIGSGFQLHGFLTNHKTIDLHLFQSHKNVDVGFKLGLNSTNRATFGAAAFYKPSNETFINCRVEESGTFGLSYGIEVVPGATLGVSWEAPAPGNYNALKSGIHLDISV